VGQASLVQRQEDLRRLVNARGACSHTEPGDWEAATCERGREEKTYFLARSIIIAYWNSQRRRFKYSKFTVNPSPSLSSLVTLGGVNKSNCLNKAKDILFHGLLEEILLG
jgi:hypothetical protein